MTRRQTRQQISEQAIIHVTPAQRVPTTVDRTFELPTQLYAITAALFIGFIAVMAMGVGNPELIIPLGICVVFIGMYFAVPTLWTRMGPNNARSATSWSRFRQDGIMTAFGHISANAATVQVLILPALIFAWGIAVVTIIALIR